MILYGSLLLLRRPLAYYLQPQCAFLKQIWQFPGVHQICLPTMDVKLPTGRVLNRLNGITDIWPDRPFPAGNCMVPTRGGERQLAQRVCPLVNHHVVRAGTLPAGIRSGGASLGVAAFWPC